MSYLLAQILICLLIAGLIGGIIGWLLRGGCKNKLRDNDEYWESKIQNNSSGWETKVQGLMLDNKNYIKNSKNKLLSTQQKVSLFEKQNKELTLKNSNLLLNEQKLMNESQEELAVQNSTWKRKFNTLQTAQLEKDYGEVGELKTKIAFFETQNIKLDKKFTMEKLAFKEKEDALNFQISNLNNEKKEFEVKLFEKSRREHKDNLQLIKGIGKVLEVRLNKLGIYQFEQIASWDEKKVDEINEQLSFAGRIEREEWIEQAKKLQIGEETEFSQRVTRGEVPTSKKD